MQEQFWAALASQGLSTMKEFRELWLKAQSGDSDGVEQIYRIRNASELAGNIVAIWAAERRFKLRPRPSETRAPKSQWERHMEKARASKWTPFYPGGLPSLGKKAK